MTPSRESREPPRNRAGTGGHADAGDGRHDASNGAVPGGIPVPTWVRVVGKVRPGVAIEAARSELQSVFDQIAKDFPTLLREDRVLRVVPLQQRIVGRVQVALTSSDDLAAASMTVRPDAGGAGVTEVRSAALGS